MDTKSNASLAKANNTYVKEWIVRIGIVSLFVVFVVTICIVNFRYMKPISPSSNGDLGLLIWQSITGVASGAVFIIDLIVSCLLLRYAKQLRKNRVICMSVLVYAIALFDNVAILYPFRQSWIAIVNLIAILICAAIVLLQKQEESHAFEEIRLIENGITKLYKQTGNEKLIAEQLYKVKTSLISTDDYIERVRFEVSHVGSDYVRAGYDINSISQISYELDRDIVDSFPIILRLYQELRNKGDDKAKDALLRIINEKISALESRLQTIETQSREITKDDCCIARTLTIFMSFKRLLEPPRESNESQDYYIGEISIHDGDLNLSPDIEYQLFTLYRTGILGAALLGTDLRHVFHYRKNGAKNGRKYCVTQLISQSGKEKNNFTSQTMYICVFTIKESPAQYVPGYMFGSISEREKKITDDLVKAMKGGEVSV